MLLLGNATISSANPESALKFFNLGMTEQSQGHHRQAIAYFEKSRAKDPENWKACLAEATSLMITDRQLESIALLQTMCTQAPDSFDKQYKLCQALLYFNKPEMALDAASKAVKLADTREKRSKSLVQLYLCLIRANRADRAQELQQQIFDECKPADERVYIYAAEIAPATNPDMAKNILGNATINLDKTENSGTFFRLAQIFDTRSKFVAYDSTKYGAWLKNSEAAYQQALKLNPNPPVYRIALAANAAEQSNKSELINELLIAHQTEPQDQLPGYLLSKLKPLQIATSNLAGVMPDSRVNLTKAKLAIDGLKCSCKRSLIINSFKQINGLVLTTISPKFPYTATILIDESMLPIDEMLSKIANKPLPEFTYRLISSSQSIGTTEALKLDLDGHNIIYPPFIDSWPEVQPFSQH